MRWTFTLAATLLASSWLFADKPNIVVILCDDLGTGDVTAFNAKSKIATPHMDKLAAQGMMFTDAHSGSGVCSPTRYGLMTGRYAWRSPLQKGVLGGLSPRLIEPNRETIASFLKSQGYRTSCVGKWHIGFDWALKPGGTVNKLNIESREQVFNVRYDQPFTNGPTAVGFDYYFGISASLDMVPYTFLENDRVTKLPTEDRDWPMMVNGKGGRCRKGPCAPDFDIHDVLPSLRDKACEIITTGAKAKTPFFLYLPFTAPHTPIAPKESFVGKSGINPYADFVMATDDAVGKVLKAIDDAGIADNTLVIFTSDNGCSPQADFPTLLAKDHNPNHIYRGHKADVYEGGHRVPFIVRWPGRVKPGTSTAAITCLGDIYRTCADVLGQKLPDTCAEDSYSFLPVLLGVTTGRTHLVNHSINGSFAIRDGDWKLCFCPGSGGWSKPRPGQDDTSTLPPLQLFNLKDDIGETKNLIAEQPERVKAMTAVLEKIVAEGRSTPGAMQKNTVEVNFRAAGEAAMKPVGKKK
ncbi:arylsulfatase [soil metagenome]